MRTTQSTLLSLALIAAFIGVAHADPVAISPRRAPQLTGSPWLNGQPPASPGKVRLLLFWTRGCINCKHNLGYWNDWAKEYNGTDVDVVSVHTPEGDWEHTINGVRDFVRKQGLTFPVLIDNSHANWDAYAVRAWPTEILIDKRGVIRYQFDGELNWNGSGEYKTVHSLIEKLRAEK